jgi:hypothetical protein
MAHEYLHTAKYGNPGGAHTMKPMFVKRDNHIYKSEYHPDVVANTAEGEKALYHVRDNKIFASADHPDAGNPHALFTIHENGVIRATHSHPEHKNNQPVFVLGGEKPDASFIERAIKNA